MNTFQFSEAESAKGALRKLFDCKVGGTPNFYCSVLMLSRVCGTNQRMFRSPILRRQPTHAYLETFCQLISLPSDTQDRSGRKRRITDTTMRELGSECGGMVYGTTAGQMLAFLGCGKGVVPKALRVLHTALTPVSQAVLTMLGPDATHLCAGLFTHRQARAQMTKLSQQSGNQPSVQIHSRFGSSSMIVGATVAIYCVFRLLSSHAVALDCGATAQSFVEDVDWMMNNNCLLDSVVHMETVVRGAVPRHGFAAAQVWEVAAVEAELRALQRAKVGVRVAIDVASKHGLSSKDAFELQLDYFAKAGFPATSRLAPNSHAAMLDEIANPLFFASQQTANPQPQAFHGGFVVPLSQLAGVARKSGDGNSETSSMTDGSTLSHPLSIASSGNSEAGSDLGTSFTVLDL